MRLVDRLELLDLFLGEVNDLHVGLDTRGGNGLGEDYFKASRSI